MCVEERRDGREREKEMDREKETEREGDREKEQSEEGREMAPSSHLLSPSVSLAPLTWNKKQEYKEECKQEIMDSHGDSW